MSIATQARTGLEIRKVHPHIGAEVSGIDLGAPLPAGVFAQIRDAFHEHSVLVFRGQNISDEQQVAFSARFGELERTSFTIAADNPYIYKLSNIDAHGDVLPSDSKKRTFLVVNMRWHTDSSFRVIPAMASALSAREVPATEAGDTEFASMRIGWETLPEDKRAAIEGLSALHSYAYTLGHFGEHGVKKSELDELPSAEHPLVRSDHPTGRKTLFVSGHIERLVGMAPEAGRALKVELIDWCTRPGYVYRHRWRRHDLVVWDNRCALHRATNIPVRERRLMHRTTVAGVGPVS
jgi:alpha-ketoglutarate-dependent 2,4-dichlorophenoxyacetate dioxygenase